jgi:hypothetical protein
MQKGEENSERKTCEVLLNSTGKLMLRMMKEIQKCKYDAKDPVN